MTRAYNFSPGPATIPEEVLRQAADEMLDWRGTGMSVMEMSHRGADYAPVIAEAQADLRTLLDIPPHYEVLFMQGGALAENAIVPLNMVRGRDVVDYVDTGIWSVKSVTEARRYCTANVIALREGRWLQSHPETERVAATRGAAYVHICGNETIGGVEYHWTPDVEALYGPDTVLACDMSSHILSRPVDVTCFGLIYGGAQKNVSMAGLTFVIVREDLIGQAHPLCPSAFDYKIVADNDSMFNTPPTYAILSSRPRLQVAVEASGGDRSSGPHADGGDAVAERGEGQALVRRAGRIEFLHDDHRARGPIADERDVPARGRHADDALRAGGPPRPG